MEAPDWLTNLAAAATGILGGGVGTNAINKHINKEQNKRLEELSDEIKEIKTQQNTDREMFTLRINEVAAGLETNTMHDKQFQKQYDKDSAQIKEGQDKMMKSQQAMHDLFSSFLQENGFVLAKLREQEMKK